MMHSAIVQALAMALGLAATVVSVPTNPMIKVLGTSLSEMVQPVRCMVSYVVKPGDTCMAIIQQHPQTVTLEQLLTWNPSIRRDCTNLVPNQVVCIRAQMMDDCASASATQTATAMQQTTTDTQTITVAQTAMMKQTVLPVNCMASYVVKPGDTCMAIIEQHPLTATLEQLLTWNPSIRGDCTNLMPNQAVCIRAQMMTDCSSA